LAISQNGSVPQLPHRLQPLLHCKNRLSPHLRPGGMSSRLLMIGGRLMSGGRRRRGSHRAHHMWHPPPNTGMPRSKPANVAEPYLVLP